MKRFVTALAGIMILAVGATSCVSTDVPLEVQGVVPPSDGCTYAPGATTFEVLQPLQVTLMGQLNHGSLLRYMGLQVQNNMSSQLASAPGATSTLTTAQDDVQIESADIQAKDGSGATLASFTVAASGYVPGGGQGVAVFNYLAKPLADSLRAQSDAFQMFLKITLHGHLASGGAISAGEYSFEVDVKYDTSEAVFPDGGLLDTGDGGSGILIPDGTQQCY